MSKKIRKWSDEYAQYGFTYIAKPDGIQRPQFTISKYSNRVTIANVLSLLLRPVA